MKASNPASEVQVQAPAAPPVEIMYFFPAATNLGIFAWMRDCGLTPAQVSELQDPVANAHVTVSVPESANASTTDMRFPVTIVLRTLVLAPQSIPIAMSLYADSRILEGLSVGGIVTGGAVTGGFVTGGAVTGGSVTGGAVTGGLVTGGAVTGGKVTGG